MNNCLLIGNGLNQCLKNSISWGNLLKGIAEEYGVSYNDNISMPLEFERIVNEYLMSQEHPTTKIYSKIKESVASKIGNTHLPTDDDVIHNRIKKLPIQAIITTNYDYLLEYVFDPDYKHQGDRTKKYLFDPTSVQKGVSFYHAHGFAASVNSICLGYEHYMGIVKRLREDLNTKENGIASKMKIRKILFGEMKPQNSWGELFYTSNIGIVGLGLADCEVDLWWLITHRAYLYYANYYGIRKRLKNKITYFDIVDRRENKIDQAQLNRHELLKNEHIDVKVYILGKDYRDYEEAYHAIFDDIEKNGLGYASAPL